MNPDELSRHADTVLAATANLHHDVDAGQLCAEAARAAEQSIPGPVGAAVAAVLASEAWQLRRLRCTCLARRPELALALAVLDHHATDDYPGDPT